MPLFWGPVEEDDLNERDLPPTESTSKRSFSGKVAGLLVLVGIIAAFVYQGVTGLRERTRPPAEDFLRASKPEFEPEDFGTVVAVYDGDTIRLADGRRIRYLGIDTPETAKPYRGDPEGDPYAEEALAFNREWVGEKKVGLIYGRERKDHYGRTLAYVIVDGTCVNAELLRQGLALSFIPDKYFKYKDWFLKAQQEAKQEGRGIWNEKGDGMMD